LRDSAAYFAAKHGVVGHHQPRLARFAEVGHWSLNMEGSLQVHAFSRWSPNKITIPGVGLPRKDRFLSKKFLGPGGGGKSIGVM
jgi:hypothetical protein